MEIELTQSLSIVFKLILPTTFSYIDNHKQQGVGIFLTNTLLPLNIFKHKSERLCLSRVKFLTTWLKLHVRDNFILIEKSNFLNRVTLDILTI